MTLDDVREMRDGLLIVRMSREEAGCRVALEGEMDLSNAQVAKEALHEAIETPGQIVVDMSLLSFIDSTGIALLVSLLHEAGACDRLGFVPSQFPAVTRVLQITGVDHKLAPQEPAAQPTAEA